MLRFVVGDSNFWNILKSYAQLYAYGNATTEDFKRVCENIYKGDLDWFFEQWIYESGYPIYQFGWGYIGKNKVRIIVNQVQENFPLFRMPVELRFVFATKNINKKIWIEKRNNSFDFLFDEKPLDVIFDPNNWIFCKTEKYYKKRKRRR